LHNGEGDGGVGWATRPQYKVGSGQLLAEETLFSAVLVLKRDVVKVISCPTRMLEVLRERLRVNPVDMTIKPQVAPAPHSSAAITVYSPLNG